MQYSHIVSAVERLKKRYHETDPFELCKAGGIILLFRPLGTDPDSVKGFFLEIKRIKTITINSDLPELIQKFIAAHELGHAELHRKLGLAAFNEVSLYDESSQYEKEANLFAGELLLDDNEVLDTLNDDSTFFTAAAKLRVPPELLDFKFRVMKWKGYKLIEPPVRAKSNFLKNLDINAEDEFVE